MPQNAPSRRNPWVPLAGGLISLALLFLLTSPWNADVRLLTPPRDEPTFRTFIEVWIWWAAAVNLVVSGLLAASWRWWIAPDSRHREQAIWTALPCPRRQWMLLGLSVLVAAYSGFPRLGHSLWGDELIAFRESVAGHFSHDPGVDGLEASMTRIYWSEAGWADALWQYETPNPHFLYNLAGKATLTFHQNARQDEPWTVREWPLRIVPFLAGLGALAVWFVLLRRIGAAAGAGWCCLALSLHPWFIRYLTEARGYAFVFLLLPLVLLALRGAIRDPRWRNWTLFGILGGLLVYSWPGMIVAWICLNAAAVCGPGRTRLPRRRLVLTNIVLGMVLLFLVAPCFAQLGPYLTEDATRLPLGASWLRDLTARMLLGIDWHDHGDYSRIAPQYISVASLWRSPVPAILLAIVGLAALAGGLSGIAFFARKGEAHRWFGAGIAVSALLMYFPAALSGIYLFHWYFVFLLPCVVALLATGLDSLARSAPWARIPVALAFVAFGILTSRETLALRARSADPRRESALAARGTLDPQDRRNDGILTAHVGTTALGYDPLGWFLEEKPEPDAPGLPTLMRMADTLKRELLVNVGYPANARVEVPSVMRIIDRSGFFERVHVLHGLEPQFEREIYRYTGGMFASLRNIPKE